MSNIGKLTCEICFIHGIYMQTSELYFIAYSIFRLHILPEQKLKRIIINNWFRFLNEKLNHIYVYPINKFHGFILNLFLTYTNKRFSMHFRDLPNSIYIICKQKRIFAYFTQVNYLNFEFHLNLCVCEREKNKIVPSFDWFNIQIVFFSRIIVNEKAIFIQSL